MSFLIQNHSHIFSSENLKRRRKSSDCVNVAQSLLHSRRVSVSRGWTGGGDLAAANFLPVSPTRAARQSPPCHAGCRFLQFPQWEASKNQCVSSRSWSAKLWHINQMKAPPTSLICLRGPLAASPEPRSVREQKKPCCCGCKSRKYDKANKAFQGPTEN